MTVLFILCVFFAASCSKIVEDPVSPSEQEKLNFFTDIEVANESEQNRMTELDAFDSDATIKKRFVTFDGSIFKNATARQSQIELPLFADATVRVRTTEIKKNGDVDVWKGIVDGDPFSRATIVWNGNDVMGNIHTGDRIFRITPLGEGKHVIGEVIQYSLPPEACNKQRKVGDNAGGQFGGGAHTEVLSTSGQKTTANVIRVMVVLKNSTIFCSSSFPGIQDVFRVACEESLNDVWNTNHYTTGYTASVLIACSGYSPQGGDFEDDIDWLASNSAIALLRDMFFVDLVSLFAENGDWCGLGNTPTVSDSSDHRAFSVVKTSCAFDNYSFAHELGHNLGDAA